MVRAVDPDWAVREARLADEGYLSVYHVTAETPAGPRDCVLKASVEDGDHGVATEARVLRILGAHTSIPVPDVFGAVDAHEDADVPTPFFVMESMPGRTTPRRDVGTLPDRTLERVARETGRYLAELHALDAFEAYGYLEPADAGALRGERPPADCDAVRVADPEPSWPARLREWVDRELDRHAGTRFADLTPALRDALDEEVGQVTRDWERAAPEDGAFRPAFGHVDASIENVLHDPATGEVTAVLDWAFTLSTPPAYDLVCVEGSLAGGHWALVPSAPDLAPLVRESLLAGYRPYGPDGVVEQFRAHHDCYALLSLVREMNLFEQWFAGRDATDEQVEGAARGARDAARSFL